MASPAHHRDSGGRAEASVAGRRAGRADDAAEAGHALSMPSRAHQSGITAASPGSMSGALLRPDVTDPAFEPTDTAPGFAGGVEVDAAGASQSGLGSLAVGGRGLRHPRRSLATAERARELVEEATQEALSWQSCDQGQASGSIGQAGSDGSPAAAAGGGSADASDGESEAAAGGSNSGADGAVAGAVTGGGCLGSTAGASGCSSSPSRAAGAVGLAPGSTGGSSSALPERHGASVDGRSEGLVWQSGRSIVSGLSGALRAADADADVMGGAEFGRHAPVSEGVSGGAGSSGVETSLHQRSVGGSTATAGTVAVTARLERQSQGGSGRIAPPLSAAEAAVAELFAEPSHSRSGKMRPPSGAGRTMRRTGTEPRRGDRARARSSDGRRSEAAVAAESLSHLSTVNESGATIQDAAGGAAASGTQGSGSRSSRRRSDRPSACGRADSGAPDASRPEHQAPSRDHHHRVRGDLPSGQDVEAHASRNPPKSLFAPALPAFRSSARVAPAPTPTPAAAAPTGGASGGGTPAEQAPWRPPPPLVDVALSEPVKASNPAMAGARAQVPLTSKPARGPALPAGRDRRPDAAHRAAAGSAGGGPRGPGGGGGAAFGMHSRAASSALHAAAADAQSASASLAASTRRDWLSRLVSQNPLMVAISGDFRESARLSLRALAELTAELDSSRQAVLTALSAGVSDAEAAECLALVAAMEERVGGKLQSLLEFAQTSVVAIGKKMAVPLPAEHMAALGRAMNANIAVLGAEADGAGGGGGVGGVGGGVGGGGGTVSGWGSGGVATVAGASGASHARSHRKHDGAHPWVSASASGSTARAAAGQSYARIRDSSVSPSHGRGRSPDSAGGGRDRLPAPLSPGSLAAAGSFTGPVSAASAAAAAASLAAASPAGGPWSGSRVSGGGPGSRFRVVSGGAAEAQGSSPGCDSDQSRSLSIRRTGSTASSSRRKRASVEWVSHSRRESGATFGRSGSVDGSDASREVPLAGTVLDAVAITQQLEGKRSVRRGGAAGSASGSVVRSVRRSHAQRSSDSGV